MPELPEVQTIVSDLQKILPGLKIVGVETDWKKMFKNVSFENFKKQVSDEKILDVRRVGKNILIDLSGEKNNSHPPENDRPFFMRQLGTGNPARCGRGKMAGQRSGGDKRRPSKPLYSSCF